MTKESYLAELAHHLKKLPKNDYQNAMAYYTEYFEEAGPENEAQVIEELGNPRDVAAELVQALLQGNAETSAPPPKNRSPWAIFGIAMAALLLSPLGLAGLCLGIGLMIAAFCVIGALIVSTVVAEFGLIVQGGQFIVQGIGLLTNAFGSGLIAHRCRSFGHWYRSSYCYFMFLSLQVDCPRFQQAHHPHHSKKRCLI